MVVKVAGSKGRYLHLLKPYLTRLLDGETDCADAFVGGGSVLRFVAELFPHLQLHANDLDPLTAAFWRVVSEKEGVEQLCRMVEEPPTREVRARLLKNQPTDPVERAWAGVVLSRTSMSGFLRAKMFNGGRDETCLVNLLEHWSPAYMVREIWRYHSLLAGRLTVSEQDGIEFVRQHSQLPLFADPPYLKVGHRLYRHYLSLESHRRLAAALRTCRKALVTYDDCKEVRSMFDGHMINRFEVNYSGDRSSRNNYQDKRREELIISLSNPNPLPRAASRGASSARIRCDRARGGNNNCNIYERKIKT